MHETPEKAREINRVVNKQGDIDNIDLQFWIVVGMLVGVGIWLFLQKDTNCCAVPDKRLEENHDCNMAQSSPRKDFKARGYTACEDVIRGPS
jgi:hypothetical protein